MRENAREEELDTTKHLIEFHIFTHPSHVTKFSLLIFETYTWEDMVVCQPLHSYLPNLR